MPDYPTPSQLATLIPEFDAIELVEHGGQKIVYSAYYRGEKAALNLIRLPDKQGPNVVEIEEEDEEGEEESDIDTATERAKREFAILEKVNTPMLARIRSAGVF